MGTLKGKIKVRVSARKRTTKPKLSSNKGGILTDKIKASIDKRR